MKFIYSEITAKTKPDNAAPYQRKENYIFADVSVAEACQLVGDGHAWRAGLYPESAGTFKKKEVAGAQILALDFDACDATPKEVISYAEEIGFQPSFWYYSYSQGIKPKNNFRVCWALAESIRSKTYEEVYAVLLKLFASFGPDTATKDCSRLWYGGRNATLICGTPIPLSSVGWLALLEKAKMAQNLSRAAKGQKACLPNYEALDVPDVFYVKRSRPWWELLRGRCPLWDKYERGEYLDYNQRLTLFSNLKFLRYSDPHFSVQQDIMGFYNPDTWKGHTFDEAQLMSIMRSQTLKPFPIVKNAKNGVSDLKPLNNILSDYKSEGKKFAVFATVPEFFQAHYNDAPIFNPMEKVSLEELDEWMDINFPIFLETEGISYLSCQTGSGKTERMLDYLARYPLDRKKVLYAVPTYALIEEVKKRFAEKNSEAEAHYLPQGKISATDKMYFQLGLPAKTKNAERQQFIQQMREADHGLYVITHALLALLDEVKADLIVVDENIEDALIRNSKLTIDALSALAGRLEGKSREHLLHLVDTIRNGKQGDFIRLDDARAVVPDFRAILDEYLNSVSVEHIPQGFFNCMTNDAKISAVHDVPCARICEKSPLIQNALASHTPLKLISATPMPKRIDEYYHINTNVLTAPKARNAGRIILYNRMTGARGKHNEKLKDLCDYACKAIPAEEQKDMKVITFKALGDELGPLSFQMAEKNGEQVSLSNCAGLDQFKGKTIAILGKYDRPEEYYQDLWDDIGDGSPLTRNQHRLSIHGFETNIFVYDQPVIQQEQLDFINYVTEQAAGRARALRELGATVYIFCDYPIADVDEIRP